MLDHPSQFSKKLISNLFNSSEENLKTFNFVPVGSGQVGDCFRVNIDWKEKNNLPSSFIAKCPAADQSSRDTARNLHLYEIETSLAEQPSICGICLAGCMSSKSKIPSSELGSKSE